MRILKLRFQNLNSLAGKWEIDFTVPEYSSGAIFAIVGSTGSGKTTILDAISLALYGKTPRLDTISQTSNEIMTRHTKECCTEVEFETSKGKFTCRWSQRFAQRHPHALQPPKHEFVDEMGKIYTSKKRDVKTEIIKATGLNFKQFTQSVLLAQGQFATFLNAEPKKERSSILEQITGSDYSKISKEINKRKSTEERKLEELQSKAEDIAVLSPTDEEELISQKNEIDNQSNNYSIKIRDLETKIRWRKQLDELQNQIDTVNEEKRIFEIEKENASKYLELLDIAKKAKTIESEFIPLTTKRVSNNENLAALKTSQEQKPTLQKNFDESDLQENTVAEKLGTLKSNWELEKPIINQVRSLDQSIHYENSRMEELASERQRTVEKCQQEKNSLDADVGNLDTKNTNLQISSDYLSKHEIDGTLGESLSALNPRFETYWSLDKAIKKKTTQLGEEIESQDSSQTLAESQKRDLDKKLLLQSNQGKAIKTKQDEILNLLKNQKISFWRKKEAALVKDIEKLNRLKASVETSKNADVEIKKLKKESDKFTKKYQNHLKTLKGLSDEKENLIGLINDLENQVRQQNQVKDLDNERKSLEDNKPCPLCGSLDHPYAKGNIPVPDKTIKKLDQYKQKLDSISEKISAETEEKVRAEADIKQSKKDQKRCQEELKNIDHIWVGGCKNFGFDIKTPDKILVISHLCKKKNNEQNGCHGIIETVDEEIDTLTQMKDDLKKLDDEIFRFNKDYLTTLGKFNSQKAEKERLEKEIRDDTLELDEQYEIINQIFIKYGYPETIPEQWSDLRRELSERNTEYCRQNESKKRLESEKNQLEGRIQSYHDNIDEFQRQLKDKNDQIALQKGKVDEIILQRNTLYGDKTPDNEEERLSTEINETTNTLKDISTGKHAFEIQLNAILVKITGLEGKISADNSILQDLERKFLSSLQSAGFTDETTFSDARLPLDIFNKYQECETHLKTEEIRLQSIIQNRTEALNQERQKNLTELSPEKLSEEFGIHNDQLKVLQQKIGEITGKLNINADAKTKYGDLQVKLEKQRAETNRWKNLDEYIGSPTGIKFQIIAQKLTFKQLIAHANHHLRAMSDRRYFLIPTDTVELEMDIIDYYQAGVKRSTKNLSGGESFIVSLALALGLSSMSSKKVQIDSFFLDEGFGTLDDESLDTALVTLSELERKGKLIGIISHVPAIKERISTQIVVEKQSRGRSRLKGPGVKGPKQVASS